MGASSMRSVLLNSASWEEIGTFCLLPTSQKAVEGEVQVQLVHKVISGHQPASGLLTCQENCGAAFFISWLLRIPYSFAISLIHSHPSHAFTWF